MNGSRQAVALQGCLAAALYAFSLGAAGQAMPPDQAQVGLERAVRTPLEIVWLRNEILAQLWRQNPGLAHGRQDCSKAGAPKQGCAIGSPPPAGQGLFIVASGADNAGLMRVPGGEVVLAAGSFVQLIDAAYPSIRIEISAPRDKPLPLGNLVSADIHKVVALLARQPDRTMLASAAPAPSVVPHVDIDRGARVAMSANGEGNGNDVLLYAPIAPAPATDEIRIVVSLPEIDQRTRPVLNSNGEGNGADVVVYAVPVPVKETVAVAANPDLARLRAEVEAEIARDRARVAASLQADCSRTGAHRQGCAVASPPKRFVFAGA